MRAVEQAWFENTVLRIEYAGHAGMTKRRVRLQSIVMERGETLLNCLDLDKNESRQFKLDRIQHARQETARTKTT
jgi:predicted DNA-binding transcriptional regulator YafY